MRAREYGFAGAMWPWESAFTGCDCVPEIDPEGRYEQHIVGDITVAFRQYWYATGNRTWLQTVAKPVIDASCTFFQCRATPVPVKDAHSVSAPPSLSTQPLGPQCSPKPVAGNYTLLEVMPPDESAGIVNSSACVIARVGAGELWLPYFRLPWLTIVTPRVQVHQRRDVCGIIILCGSSTCTERYRAQCRGVESHGFAAVPACFHEPVCWWAR